MEIIFLNNILNLTNIIIIIIITTMMLIRKMGRVSVSGLTWTLDQDLDLDPRRSGRSVLARITSLRNIQHISTNETILTIQYTQYPQYLYKIVQAISYHKSSNFQVRKT